MIRYVLGFMFSGQSVALVKKAKPAWQEGKWNGIGGKIEPGENSIDAMVREFNEEARVLTSHSAWKYFASYTCYPHNTELFLFKSFVKHCITIKGSLIEPVQWRSIHDNSNWIPNLNWLIPYALHAEDMLINNFVEKS